MLSSQDLVDRKKARDREVLLSVEQLGLIFPGSLLFNLDQLNQLAILVAVLDPDDHQISLQDLSSVPIFPSYGEL